MHAEGLASYPIATIHVVYPPPPLFDGRFSVFQPVSCGPKTAFIAFGTRP